jgi:carbon storage regulator
MVHGGRVMLVLSRKVDEAIYISGQIKVKILKVRGNQVSVGIDAPRDVSIVRSELAEWSEFCCDDRKKSESQSKQDLMFGNHASKESAYPVGCLDNYARTDVLVGSCPEEAWMAVDI